MKLFRYEHFFNRLKIEILSLKFSFLIPRYRKNYYISLGSNCFPRFKLTTVGLKAYRKNGELSCPFDLCVTPIHSISQILLNDFKDYFDDLVYDCERKIWVNTKYNIEYLHDDNLTGNEFVSRYKKRIVNFKQLSTSMPELMFILVDFNRNYNVLDINSIYNYISKLRNNKPFKFVFISYVDENSPKIQLSGLNENIFYKEYYSDSPVLDFKETWHKNFPDTHPLIFAPLKDIKDYADLK